MKKGKLVSLLVFTIVLAILVTACGGGQSQPAEKTGGSETEKSEPKVGGDLVVGLAGDPYSIAPWVSNDLNSALIANLIVPPIMVTDDQARKVPYILKDYEVSDDAKVYTVTIHDGLTWHDGTPFTAEDLAFTCEYTREKSLGHGADMFAAVEKVEVIDDTTVKYYLSKPQVNFLSQTGFWINIMPKHIFENVEDPMNFDYDGTGYGPFKLKEYKKGEYYTFERVPNWPLANDGLGAYLETITFRIFPDPNALVLAMKNGEVHVSGSAMPIASQKQLEASPDKFGIMKVNSLGYGYISFNYKNELLADKNVRKAFAMTIDRDALVNTALQGGAIKMETPISPVYKDLVKSNIKFPAFDIEGAKKVLTDAGYTMNKDGVMEKNGKKLEFELIYRTTTANVDAMVNIVKANAEKAGFAINLKPVDPATYTDRVVKQRNFDINLIEWGVIDDPDSSLGTIYRSDAALNFMGYKNERIDELLDMSEREISYEKRIEIMNEFQKEFVEELPSINLFVRTNAYGYSKDFEGWDLTPGLYGLLAAKDIVKVYKK
ncbi:peptide ABC transporter substrate-binding protein [Tepidanaerobacter syntrophicus]|uniref:Peptide/nickel transport system substrate-binding protein n=1 Tax=Tepidanaerobacter syntrophicus TaxID=224999 RepID=A0A0U9HF06_9FIRM|nr:ABC transporter substrate-binding protein [Tepidanaerobacter syntrophicus]GAQ24468.1 peptide/nickel transport system substrate-binding protein [Tepidanaerobacter syntrophicus]GLI18234.1 peptide ABC transporter substrate-binding protein [Tepidanaerobacter syntrophicus]GLI52007.1 peptide ABC transporter substrate-binding protein [Tepidanaerobacter syntrophicus]HHV82554.1 ABC transporter substrate-binding protein [Tepidanaerobacter syntrophicus]